MKIDRIDTVRLDDFPNLIWVQVFSDDGVVGTGETFFGVEAVEAHIHSTAGPLILDEDPLRLEHIRRVLSGYVGYAGSGTETRARSAIDMALWDLRARASGVPLHDTMGGRTREAIRVYNTCAGSQYVRRDGQSTENWGLGLTVGPYEDLERFLVDAGGLAAELLDEGISGMKIWPLDRYAEASLGTAITSAELREGLQPFGQIRDAVGDRIDVMLEMHALWSVPTAKSIVRAVAEYSPFWIEDPVRSDLIGGLRELAQVTAETGTLLAAGETVSGLAGFAPLLSDGAIDVVTVDLGWGGGISEALNVAALAAAHGRFVAPHDCTGPIALAAATHLSVSVPNALVQETVRAAVRGWYADLVTSVPRIEDGLIRPAAGPGIGLDLQPDLASRRGATYRTSRRRSIR